jgi:chromosome partitioning protein
MDIENSNRKTEIIAFCSGKGGAGKTLFASCLGFALRRSGHKVLMIDGDPATDGLSLFLLGPKGMDQISTFLPENTFTGILRKYQADRGLSYKPRNIFRSGPEDHEVDYEALISGRGLYGEASRYGEESAVPDLDQATFRSGISALFDSLRNANQYDYVIVDTRGGFAFESTDVCALADSFIVVIEADYTSFYQTSNLVRRIGETAAQLETRSVLRAFMVNKAVDGVPERGRLQLPEVEKSFRLLLEGNFPVKFVDTHPVPADINVLRSYKDQRIPFLAFPESPFSFATISAFSDVLQVVTSQWSVDQVKNWNRLVHQISDAVGRDADSQQKLISDQNTREKSFTERGEQLARSLENIEFLKKENDRLERENLRIERIYERELSRIPTQAHSSSEKPSSESAPPAAGNLLRWAAVAVPCLIAVALGVFWFSSRPITPTSSSATSTVVDSTKGSTPPLQTIPLMKEVLIQIAHESQREKATGLQVAARDAGFLSPEIEVVPHGTFGTYVRYFQTDDLENANKLAEVAQSVGFSPTIQNFVGTPTSTPNALEIWIGDKDFGKSKTGVTNSSSAAVQLPTIAIMIANSKDQGEAQAAAKILQANNYRVTGIEATLPGKSTYDTSVRCFRFADIPRAKSVAKLLENAGFKIRAEFDNEFDGKSPDELPVGFEVWIGSNPSYTQPLSVKHD